MDSSIRCGESHQEKSLNKMGVRDLRVPSIEDSTSLVQTPPSTDNNLPVVIVSVLII